MIIVGDNVKRLMFLSDGPNKVALATALNKDHIPIPPPLTTHPLCTLPSVPCFPKGRVIAFSDQLFIT